MFNYYTYSNTAGILVDTDDVLNLQSALGPYTVNERLAAAPWLRDYIFHQWAPTGEEGYCDAYGGVARIIVTSAVLDSLHPDDIAYALGLPPLFVRVILLCLDTFGWRKKLLPQLARAVTAPADVRTAKVLIDNFMLSAGTPRVEWLDLLKVMGPEVLGVGKAPYGVRVWDKTKTTQQWLEELPPQRKKGPKPTKFVLSEKGKAAAA